MINHSPSLIYENNGYDPEKVYVDWPEDNSEDYRFVSSRMEDVESDYYPLIAADDIRRGVDITGNVAQLKISTKPPLPIDSKRRYEDLSSMGRDIRKKSIVPSLDLISQHSSIDIPGAKGAIDIDFRSTSDSQSEDDDDRYEQEVEDKAGDRRPEIGQVPQALQENEQVAFETVQQRFKHNLRTVTQEEGSVVKTESRIANKASKLHKGKPTLMVAPQIKPSFQERTPNFVELNKDISQQKPVSQVSYANKYADRHRKESPAQPLKKQTSLKEVPLAYKFSEKVDRNPTLSANEYWNKRERSVERLTRERRNSNGDPEDRMQYRIHPQNTPQVIYAFTQYGEPLIIKDGGIVMPHGSHQITAEPPYPEYYPHQSMGPHHSSNYTISPRKQILPPQPQVRRSFDEDHISHNGTNLVSSKRQPTLYDEDLLDKKTKLLTSDRGKSNFPPLPSTSESNISLNNGRTYGSRQHKEVSYQQYTLRDFKNIKKIYTVGGLGPNVGTETHRQMKEKLMRQKNYSKAVQEKNQGLAHKHEKGHAKDSHFPLESSAEKEYDIEQEMRSEKDHLEEIDQENVQKEGTRQSSSQNPSKDAGTKRDIMINYAKTVKEKKLKKQMSRNNAVESQPSTAMTHKESPKATLELFSNDDLEKLLQRHEHDKKVADLIRQKWEKI